MLGRLRFLWSEHRLALSAFAVVLVVLVFFTVRTTTSMIYWMDPDHQDQPLEAWMTPRYVAMSYDIPPDVLGPALYLDPDAPRERITLGRIASERSLTVAQLQVRVDAAASAWRATQDAPQQ